MPLHLERELLASILADPYPAMAQSALLNLIASKAHVIADATVYERWFESVRPDVAHIPLAVAEAEGQILFLRVMEGEDVPLSAILEATNRIQERLAHSATSDEVLAALEEHGRTRAVRYYARSRRRNKSERRRGRMQRARGRIVAKLSHFRCRHITFSPIGSIA